MKIEARIFMGLLYPLLVCFLPIVHSQEHREVKELNKTVVKAFQKGKYAKAIALAQKAYRLGVSELGEEHSDTLKAMGNLAYLYQVNGNFSQAENLNLQALELRKKIAGEKHPTTLGLMNYLGGLYDSQGKYQKAEALFVQTLQLRKEVLGEKHPDTITSMNNLALTYTHQGEYRKAEPLYLKALELKKQVLGENHRDTLTSMNNLALLYHSQGKYEKAEFLHLKTLELSRKELGDSHPNTLRCMNNLATLYDSQGQFAKSEPLYLKVLASRKEILGSAHPDTLQVMNNLANLYYKQGDYAKAESSYLETLRIMKEVLGEKHPDTLVSMSNLAKLYKWQKKYAQASRLNKKVLKMQQEVLGEQHPDTLNSMDNLASVYGLQEKYVQSEALHAKALELRKESLGEKHPVTIISMNNLANLYYQQQEDTKAELLYVKALKLIREVLREKHPQYFVTMSNLAVLYQAQGQYSKALDILQQSLEAKYLFLVRELQGSSEKIRLKMLKSFSLARDRNSLFSLLELLSANSSQENYNSLALYFTANYKGILLRISQQLKQIFAGSDNQQLVEQLSQKRSEYSRLSFHYQKSQKSPSLIKKLEEEIENLEKQLIWENSNVKIFLADVKPQQILHVLSQKEVLVDFVTFRAVGQQNQRHNNKKLAAVVASKGKIKVISLGNLQAIASLVQNYRNKLQQELPVKQLASKIYQKIFSPLENVLLAKGKIYIVPDGVLHLLPFHSLVNKRGEYLAQSHNIVILSSSKDLLIQNEKSPKEPVTIFAYPNYGKGEGKKIASQKRLRFSPLIGTQREAKALAQLFSSDPKIYTKEQASERNIYQISSPQILHIATHGYFLNFQEPTPSSLETRGIAGLYVPEPPASHKQQNFSWPIDDSKIDISNQKPLSHPLVYSGLAFTGANEPRKDGILTALEVLSLHLHGTELVVLSACDTGVGKIRQGEGVYSLQRAFQEAGAETVVASLWKVDDRATRLFMKKFYQRYMRGDSAQKAARDTQLEFINSKRYSHPFYWASFVVIGGHSDDLVLQKTTARDKRHSHPDQNNPVIVWGIVVALISLLSGGIIWKHRNNQQRILQERRARQAQRQRRRQRR